MKSFHVVIPARYGSTRLPAKMLKPIVGKPMIQHVYEHARDSHASSVIIATDDERIADIARGFGAEVCMTSHTHISGTARIAEVIAKKNWQPDEVVVNLQGDEPLMPSALIDQIAVDLHEQPNSEMSSLYEPIINVLDIFNPNAVKVVLNHENFALYFSRAPIPWDRARFHDVYYKNAPQIQLPSDITYNRHLGIYAYRAGFVAHYAKLEPTVLETIESLEQLRALWYGAKIHMQQALVPGFFGVDTQADLDRVIAILNA